MSKQSVSEGVVHKLPPDLRKALSADKAALAKWEDISRLGSRLVARPCGVRRSRMSTGHARRPAQPRRSTAPHPLARNEWICWVESVKTPGCVHRKDKPLSASQKFLLGKRPKK